MIYLILQTIINKFSFFFKKIKKVHVIKKLDIVPFF